MNWVIFVLLFLVCFNFSACSNKVEEESKPSLRAVECLDIKNNKNLVINKSNVKRISGYATYFEYENSIECIRIDKNSKVTLDGINSNKVVVAGNSKLEIKGNSNISHLAVTEESTAILSDNSKVHSKAEATHTNALNISASSTLVIKDYAEVASLGDGKYKSAIQIDGENVKIFLKNKAKVTSNERFSIFVIGKNSKIFLNNDSEISSNKGIPITYESNYDDNSGSDILILNDSSKIFSKENSALSSSSFTKLSMSENSNISSKGDKASVTGKRFEITMADNSTINSTNWRALEAFRSTSIKLSDNATISTEEQSTSVFLMDNSTLTLTGTSKIISGGLAVSAINSKLIFLNNSSISSESNCALSINKSTLILKDNVLISATYVRNKRFYTTQDATLISTGSNIFIYNHAAIAKNPNSKIYVSLELSNLNIFGNFAKLFHMTGIENFHSKVSFLDEN